jgi:hypothetical protein
MSEIGMFQQLPKALAKKKVLTRASGVIVNNPEERSLEACWRIRQLSKPTVPIACSGRGQDLALNNRR